MSAEDIMNKGEREIFYNFWEEKADVADLLGSYITEKDATDLFKLGISFGLQNKGRI